MAVPGDDQEWTVYILAGHSLQKWHMTLNDPEHLVFVVELNKFVRDGFHSTVFDRWDDYQTETETWLLDIQSDKDNVIILAAGVNMRISQQVIQIHVSFDLILMRVFCLDSLCLSFNTNEPESSTDGNEGLPIAKDGGIVSKESCGRVPRIQVALVWKLRLHLQSAYHNGHKATRGAGYFGVLWDPGSITW